MCPSQPWLLFCAGFIRPCAALLLSQRDDGKSQLIHHAQQRQKELLLFAQTLSIVFYTSCSQEGLTFAYYKFSERQECVFSQWRWQVCDTGDHDILVAANRDAQTRDINSNYKTFCESIVKYSEFGFPFS